VGPLSKTVQVFTNDPENPVVMLSVKMNIEGSPLQK